MTAKRSFDTTGPNSCPSCWKAGEPAVNLPCIDGDWGPNNVSASRSQHTGGVNVVFGDASVHFMSQSINIATWQALVTISGGEVISGNSY